VTNICLILFLCDGIILVESSSESFIGLPAQNLITHALPNQIAIYLIYSSLSEFFCFRLPNSSYFHVIILCKSARG
jgi:hypothetical protein